MPTAKVTVLLFAAESILPVAKARHVVGSFRKYSGYAVCCGKNSNSKIFFLQFSAIAWKFPSEILPTHLVILYV